MKKLILPLLVFFSACSSIAENKKNQYLVLNELWEKQSTRSEVVKILGNGFKEVDSGIVYTYPNSNRPRIGLFFDSSNKLREQFVFLQEAALQEFKKAMKCKWKETEEVRDIVHYQRTIKKGSCSELNINYETYLDLNAYELRWKR
jgi:hypothetical protein